MTPSRSHRTIPAAVKVAVVALLFLAACSGGGDSSARRSASRARVCAQPQDSATFQAILAYIKDSSPYPQRFLSAAGTDSALPDVGVAALQEKGPTYFYPGDSASRAKVLKRMDDMGPYTSLLVAWRGIRLDTDTTVIVRLSGGYLGGKFHGTPAVPRAFTFACEQGRWKLRRADEEKAS